MAATQATVDHVLETNMPIDLAVGNRNSEITYFGQKLSEIG